MKKYILNRAKNILGLRVDNPSIIDTYKETIRKCQDFFDTENGIRQTETFFESLIH